MSLDKDDVAVRASELAKIPDDAVDLVARGIDAKGRFGISPDKAVEICALTRGLALSEPTVELVTMAVVDPAWATAMIASILADVADGASRRSRSDQEAEADVLRTVLKPSGRPN